MADIDQARIDRLEQRLDGLLERAEAMQESGEALKKRLIRTEKMLRDTLEALNTASATLQDAVSPEAIEAEVEARFGARRAELEARLAAIGQTLALLPDRVRAFGSPQQIAAFDQDLKDFETRVDSAIGGLETYVAETLVAGHLEPQAAALEVRRDDIADLAETSAEQTATTFRELAGTLETAAQSLASNQGDWGARLQASWETRASGLHGHVSQRLEGVLNRGQEVVEKTAVMIERVQQTAEDVGSIRKTTSMAMDKSGGALTVITEIIDEIGGLLSDVK